MTVRQRHKASAISLNAAITTAFLGLLLVGANLLAGCDKGASAASTGAPPPMKVAIVKAQQADVPVTGEWVGTLDGYVNAQIQPQANGYLIRQDYREGLQVQQGQVLFEIDPRPFEAALQQAQGQLGQAQAQLALAQINVNRDTPLAEARAIARSQLDNEIQQKAQAEAAVTTAEAAVATATLNLGFTQVRSLITGVAGQATTQVGNLVSTQSVLTSVSQLDPIKVYFSISDSEYLALDKACRRGRQRPTSWSFEDSSDLDTFEWRSLPAKGSRGFCGSSAEFADGSDSNRCILSESRQHPSPRTVRPSESRNSNDSRCRCDPADSGNRISRSAAGIYRRR